MRVDSHIRRHPVLANLVIIFLVATIGLIIVFLSLNVFTRHGEWQLVPEVENMSFTSAINKLHDAGFRTDIRDSVYNDEIQPGFVVEQFPKAGSKVKPGKKIFLYINAVHPREVVIDSETSQSGEALKGYSLRQGKAKLEELGFRKINLHLIPGDNDRIIRILANGRPVLKMAKVPVNSEITIEAYDGSQIQYFDSIPDEFLEYGPGVDVDPDLSVYDDEVEIDPDFLE